MCIRDSPNVTPRSRNGVHKVTTASAGDQQVCRAAAYRIVVTARSGAPEDEHVGGDLGRHYNGFAIGDALRDRANLIALQGDSRAPTRHEASHREQRQRGVIHLDRLPDPAGKHDDALAGRLGPRDGAVITDACLLYTSDAADE